MSIVNSSDFLQKVFISEQKSMLQVVTPRIFSLVCFCLRPPQNNEDNGNKLNNDLLEAINSTGKIFISHTVSLFFFM